MKKEKALATHAVILAGGRGTRFWPRSRTRTPKQLLNIVGAGSMLQQTVARLAPLISARHVWTVTNDEQAAALVKQLPAAARKLVLSEPVGKNTAAAIALAAIHVRHASSGDALLAVLPADHYIAQPERYREIMRAALDEARNHGCMVVLGIPPTRPETGYGYIEREGESIATKGAPIFAVRCFKEKPELAVAKEYAASGIFHWNAGMFFWRISTFLDALKEFLPKTHALIEELSRHIGKRTYTAKLKRIYPQLENISVDYAILERATRQPGPQRVFVIPAEIGWSDIGSWAAVHELLAKHPAENIFAGPGHTLDAEGNFLWSPGKYVAVIGVSGLVVVETPDALLICPRDRAQDVGKIVKALEDRKHKNLL
ncbi:MAG TPA: sugar phosphate nucleotidyltransferase [Candidatus Acidoferrum sp.]|nr:sugar phosphate nucleotidyltransferase [Candidatus Acidoferrum sp.]